MAEKVYTLEELTKMMDKNHEAMERMLGIIDRIIKSLNPDYTETDKQTIQALKELGPLLLRNRERRS